jgi:hypothetical protein
VRTLGFFTAVGDLTVVEILRYLNETSVAVVLERIEMSKSFAPWGWCRFIIEGPPARASPAFGNV